MLKAGKSTAYWADIMHQLSMHMENSGFHPVRNREGKGGDEGRRMKPARSLLNSTGKSGSMTSLAQKPPSPKNIPLPHTILQGTSWRNSIVLFSFLRKKLAV